MADEPLKHVVVTIDSKYGTSSTLFVGPGNEARQQAEAWAEREAFAYVVDRDYGDATLDREVGCMIDEGLFDYMADQHGYFVEIEDNPPINPDPEELDAGNQVRWDRLRAAQAVTS